MVVERYIYIYIILTHCVFREDELPVHGLSETIVGVLGGGQLGRMLCQAASQMAIKVMVLDPQENCPASALSYYHMVGSFNDSATVEEFAKRFNILETGSHLFSPIVALSVHCSTPVYFSNMLLGAMCLC